MNKFLKDFQTHFEYSNGELFCKTTRGSVKAGSIAGYTAEDGYRRVCLNGKYFYVHKIIYLLVKGEIPDNCVIDHKDRNKQNNHIDNLRVATHRENQLNKTRQKSGTSTYKGVWFDKKKNVWKASIRSEDKRIYLGQFDTEEDAALYYDIRAIELHGKFANLNILEMPDNSNEVV